MNRTSQRIGEILISRGYIDPAQLTTALRQQQRGERNLVGFILIQLGFTGPEQITESLAIQLGFPYVDPTRERIDASLISSVSKDLAQQNHLIPIDRQSNGFIRVAMVNPRDMNALRDLEFIFKGTIAPVAASAAKIEQAINSSYAMEYTAQQMLAGADRDRRHPSQSGGQLELDQGRVMAHLRGGGNKPYVELLNFLLVSAIERKASDIHLEPQMEDMRVRFRIDGMLREVLVLPGWASKPLTSRIKVVGKLDLAAYDRPQDGKVSANLENRKLDLRIAIIPSQYGEKVVIRLLDSALLQTDLGLLGWQPKVLSAYYRMASQPQGLVLCVGPTGSGKSTTLYATIQRLQSETTSILTVEDPIEYTLPGITQIQVNEKTGMTFDRIVRSLLRQDPNVIVIGEIRDSNTADAALEAANTGHLVLSTLHTNYAVSSITRLLDLRVPPYMLGASLVGIVAQRLVRKVCLSCSVEGYPEKEDWDRFGIQPLDLGHKVRRAGAGCNACRFVGYSGRIGVIEVLAITDALRALIVEGATEADLWKQAREDGLVTLFDDALAKVASGVTTLEEVARVVPVDPWRNDTASLVIEEEPDFPAPIRTRPYDAALHGDDEIDDLTDTALQPIELEEVETGRKRILVADDAEEILQLVGITLEDDFELVLARDGTQALTQARSENPDLAILDVMMPGMSGFDVCEQLKEDPRTAHIPVLFLSARGERPHIKRGFHVGADDYLAKPFDPEELLLRVKALLRRSRRAARLA